MSPLFEWILLKVEDWMDRLVIPDDRYACGGCDDRFVSRSLGIAHILRCHPEFTSVVVYEDATKDADLRRFADAA